MGLAITKHPASWVLPAAALLIAVFAGCGASPEEPAEQRVAKPAEPAPETAPTLEPTLRYGPAADRLCAGAQAEQELARRELGGDQLTLDDRARLLVELAPSRVRLAEELALLEAPVGEEDAAAALTAAAERRGAASTLAGKRWERGAPEERIAAAAAEEHDQRVRFVEIATELDLRDCAEVLPAAQRRLIRSALGQALSSADAAERCAAFGERFLRQEYGGGRNACARMPSRTPLAEAVVVDELAGMAGVFAVARLDARGGDSPGAYRARVVFEDGAYRIDKLD